MNRQIYISCMLSLLLLFSCRDSEVEKQTGTRPAEVEMILKPAGAAITRADDPVSDPGSVDERYIHELDVLIFDQGVFAYRREAYPVGQDRYRVTLVETDRLLTAYLFANSRALLRAWEEEGGKTALDWAAVQKQLIDEDPVRLVQKDDWTPLPMWGKTTGNVSADRMQNWGNVQMLRSVASVDLYVEQTDETDLFTLTDLFVYYGPDKGYLSPAPDLGDPDNYLCVAPPDMETSLTNQLHATEVSDITTEVSGNQYEYKAIIYQLYLYDNDVTTPTVQKKYSRAILGGYYNQSGDPATWKKSYYPLDFVLSNGNFRPIVRNWKYEFRINGVYGPGYPSPGEAANNYPVDLNAEVISWDNDDVEVGVLGHYYVSKERNEMHLTRYSGSTDQMRITYRLFDEVPATAFTLAFKDETNGVTDGNTDSIWNDYFEAVLTHDQRGWADLQVIARENYTPGNDKEVLLIRFRNLQLEIKITQHDAHDNDWGSGGNDDHELEGDA